MGSKRSTTTSSTKLSKLYRPYARRLADLNESTFTRALDASREIDVSDPGLRDAVREEYLATVRGDYLDDPRLDAMAGRSADIAQRGLGGASRRFGSGAYANAVLGARANAADQIYGRERAYQFAALGMGPEQYELSTAPQRDLYRREVADPIRIAGAYTGAVAANPLAGESRSKTKTKQPFDWGGFFGNIAASWLSPPGSAGAGGGG